MPRGSAKSKSALTFVKTTILFGLLAAMLLGLYVPRADAEEPAASTSVLATWNCTGSPCPWGGQTAGQAAVWPASAQPSRARHGYTVSHDVYAPAAKVVGWEVTVIAGSASVFAGTPNDSHGSLATLDAGQSFTVPALGAGVMVSVQSGGEFQYRLTAVTPPTGGPTEEPTGQPTSSPTSQPTSSPTSQPTGQPATSVLATWNCTGSPCPWGGQTAGHAAVWPASAQPSRARHGYTVTHDVYAPAAKVVGWGVTIIAGSASVFAGTPNDSHGSLATLNAGQSFTVPALSAGVMVSVQGDGEFRYTLTTVTPSGEPTGEPTGGPTGPPTEEPTLDCTDPTDCDPVSSIKSVWRYTGSDSNPDAWEGGVIAWPSWSAFSTNNRSGLDSRVVYSETGDKLYPYMGEWADGCEVEVVSGDVLLIEWERGMDEWRETNLSAGDNYTINLTGSENGAMIEGPNTEPFEVSLSNCTPQAIDKGSSD